MTKPERSYTQVYQCNGKIRGAVRGNRKGAPIPGKRQIYAIRDHVGRIIYVGNSNNVQKRKDFYQDAVRRCRVGDGAASTQYLLAEAAAGRCPDFELDVLEIVDIAVADQREMYWIQTLLSQGHPLVNKKTS